MIGRIVTGRNIRVTGHCTKVINWWYTNERKQKIPDDFVSNGIMILIKNARIF